ncbi:MAG: hypothetical protein ACLUVY_05565 [Bacteroides uniformis]
MAHGRRHAELRHRVYVGGEELGGVAHNVAAVYGEKVSLATILLQVGVHVIRSICRRAISPSRWSLAGRPAR